ncbi:hypothetical protein BBIA_1410 [Bifidobacterium biavatii DSM 23969]|uniref:Lipoprotein n=2 Tax=Bifidobacterium biavatii TaxID=762212 RepID=A0A087A4W3_9BIFI|nr:hypothetical protein BBIA_1410 [Bifidobacterium biavatii DSM 23969]
MQNMGDEMKKRVVILSLMLVGLIAMSACGSNANPTATNNEITTIQAEYPIYDTAKEIIDSSDLVFSGTVKKISYKSLNVKSEKGPDLETGLDKSSEIPYTIFSITIDKVYKGNTDANTIAIKRPGGKVGDQVVAVQGDSTIGVGGTYLFITKTYENSYPSLLNATQASFDMNHPDILTNDQKNEGITLSTVLEYLQSTN